IKIAGSVFDNAGLGGHWLWIETLGVALEVGTVGKPGIDQSNPVTPGRHVFVPQAVADGDVRPDLPAILDVIELARLTEPRDRQGDGVCRTGDIAEHEVGGSISSGLIRDAICRAGVLVP